MTVRNWRPTDDDAYRLTALTDLDRRRYELVGQIEGQVAWMRSREVPWRAIGDALGVSAQAAQQRFGHLI